MRKIGVKLGEKFHSKTDLIVRQQLLAPGRYHKTVVVWLAEVASLRRLLRMFTETAMFCFQACSHLSFRILTDINQHLLHLQPIIKLLQDFETEHQSLKFEKVKLGLCRDGRSNML